jgi:Domain of unknown function (DUF5667)
MPAGQGNDEETFASAVERGVHPGFAGHVELGRDLEIVALLRSGGAELGPRPDERARARAQILARLAAPDDPADRGPRTVLTLDEPVAPSPTALLPADPPPAVDELGSRRARRSGRHQMPAGSTDRRRPLIGGRIVMVAAAAVLGTAVVGGGGVLASRDALPGDSLYGVKRAAESADLAMTWDDADRGRKHLDLASTRVDEMEQLVADHPQAAQDPEVYSTALHDFDSEADQGSQLLLASTDAPRDQTEADLQSWASGQAERLATLRPSLPGPAASDAADSLDRLDQLTGPDPLEGRSACVDGTCAGDPSATGTPQSGSPSTTGDPTEAGRATGTGTGTGSTGQSGTTGHQQGGQQEKQPGLLPDVLPNNPLGGIVGGSGDQPQTSSPNSSGKSGGGSGGGLPPIEVPPLLPGVGGVSIG